MTPPTIRTGTHRAGEALLGQVRAVSIEFDKPDPLLDAVLAQVGNARYVLLGEASHGTSDYYTWRARLSQRLIDEQGFSFIAVEGDWPDCYRLNRFVKGYPEAGQSAREALRAFERWPGWMWANWEVAAFAEWLRRRNRALTQPVGFYGLDVYSLWESMQAVIDFLQKTDPQAVDLARQAYACFEPFGEAASNYARHLHMVPKTCEAEVVDLLRAMQQRGQRYAADPEAAFNAEQNARVLVNAERYYRAWVQADLNSWNVRDTHMADTLDRLMDYHGPGARAIIWAHNTHIGDASATDMPLAGMINIGQLVRERHAAEGVVLIGFGSYRGSVMAGKAWGSGAEVLAVPDALPGSWEEVLYRTGPGNRLLRFGQVPTPAELLEPRPHRAIGVVYDPAHELRGNYVPTVLPERYDAFIFLPETQALHPLPNQPQAAGQVPETYPFGL